MLCIRHLVFASVGRWSWRISSRFLEKLSHLQSHVALSFVWIISMLPNSVSSQLFFSDCFVFSPNIRNWNQRWERICWDEHLSGYGQLWWLGRIRKLTLCPSLLFLTGIIQIHTYVTLSFLTLYKTIAYTSTILSVRHTIPCHENAYNKERHHVPTKASHTNLQIQAVWNV